MKWLVVCADDGGLAPSTDAAILRCAREGVVRSASVVAAGPTAEAFVREAAVAGLDLGLHVNLTEGVALAGPARSLTDADGRFALPKQEFWRRAADGVLDAAEVRDEVRAQWEWLISFGVRPTHVTGHNHVHVYPIAMEAVAKLGASIWVRVPADRERPLQPIDAWARAMTGPWHTADRFTGCSFCDEPSEEAFLACLRGEAGVTEFMVHPGCRSGSAFTESPLRDRETEALCRSTLRAALDTMGYRLAGFGELPCGS